MKVNSFLAILALLFVTSTSELHAKKYSYWQIHNMPTSIEKDYFIWRFLSRSDTTKKDAKKIIYEVTGLNKKLRNSYRKKTGKNISIPKSRLPRSKAFTSNTDWKKRALGHKNFKKAIKLLKKKKPNEAKKYLERAYQNYSKRMDIDKTVFWLYLSTKDFKYLTLLRESTNVNIYTLMAADSVGDRYPKTITESLWRQNNYAVDIKNPIDWAKIKVDMSRHNNLDDLADKYKCQSAIGIYTYIKAKASNYDTPYFPMPYRDAMRDMTPQRQAMIYAIARQESRFVPASVSRSFALGMMQFMPFLIKHIAKKKRQKVDLDDMFNPYMAIEYADFHLDYLNKYLHHPLFVAYAYNGGIGFTRKHIKGKSFRKGPYEPYMSIETMKNHEAKEYGKKVLANYVIYLNKLGVKTRIFPLLETLATPSLTDKFR